MPPLHAVARFSPWVAPNEPLPPPGVSRTPHAEAEVVSAVRCEAKAQLAGVLPTAPPPPPLSTDDGAGRAGVMERGVVGGEGVMLERPLCNEVLWSLDTRKRRGERPPIKLSVPFARGDAMLDGVPTRTGPLGGVGPRPPPFAAERP